MNNSPLIPLIIVTLVALCFVGACNPSCSIRPALINWERRQEPILPWRKKKHAAPGGLPTEGEAEGLHLGAAPTMPHGGTGSSVTRNPTDGAARDERAGNSPVAPYMTAPTVSLPPVGAGKSNRNAGNDVAGADK